jgi:hypothetical protein
MRIRATAHTAWAFHSRFDLFNIADQILLGVPRNGMATPSSLRQVDNIP